MEGSCCHHLQLPIPQPSPKQTKNSGSFEDHDTQSVWEVAWNWEWQSNFSCITCFWLPLEQPDTLHLLSTPTWILIHPLPLCGGSCRHPLTLASSIPFVHRLLRRRQPCSALRMKTKHTTCLPCIKNTQKQIYLRLNCSVQWNLSSSQHQLCRKTQKSATVTPSLGYQVWKLLAISSKSNVAMTNRLTQLASGRHDRVVWREADEQAQQKVTRSRLQSRHSSSCCSFLVSFLHFLSQAFTVISSACSITHTALWVITIDSTHWELDVFLLVFHWISALRQVCLLFLFAAPSIFLLFSRSV